MEQRYIVVIIVVKKLQNFGRKIKARDRFGDIFNLKMQCESKDWIKLSQNMEHRN